MKGGDALCLARLSGQTRPGRRSLAARKSRQAVIGANCYIERTPPFRMAGRRFVKGAIPVLLHPERLDAPLRWKKARRVFVCSLADMFHEDVPDEFIASIFAVMWRAEHHTFQVLTKRPERMRELATWTSREVGRPLPNVWLGVSGQNPPIAV